MLPENNRLKKRNDFNEILKKGKAITGKFVFLKYLKNNLNVNRFGFVVSLRISKRAVIRNRIRRQLREATRRNLSNIKHSFDVLIIAKPEIINKKYQEIRNELEYLFQFI